MPKLTLPAAGGAMPAASNVICFRRAANDDAKPVTPEQHWRRFCEVSPQEEIERVIRIMTALFPRGAPHA